MELDELKQAWQRLGHQVERQEAVQLQILRDRKLDKVRSNLRPLFWGQFLQFLLGIGLIALGVACWTRNGDVSGVFATGVLVHAFGVITAVMAVITMVLVASIDYSAPVLAIQKRMAQLLRFYTLNANVCGLPWWVMWALVIVAFFGLGTVDPGPGTPPGTQVPLSWIVINLGIGIAGLLGAGVWYARSKRRRGTIEQAMSEDCDNADGGDGIRRGRKLLDEIARFERE